MKRKYLISIALVLCLLIVGAGSAEAKSLYVISDINANPSPIQAYDIQANSIVYQATDTVPRYGGGAVGLGIDTDSKFLFVTYEVSNTISIVDATTMTSAGTTSAPGASNLAGIVVDQDNQKVYTMDRGTNKLYVYSWDKNTKTLTLDGGTFKNLAGVSQAYGIALDEVNDLLYVGDNTKDIKIFKTSDWSSAGTLSISQNAMGIAVDVANGYVYTGNAYPAYGSLGLLSQYDLNSDTESTLVINTVTGYVGTDNALGIAVDSDTGMVFVSTGNMAFGGSDKLLMIDSSLTLKDSTGDIGNPTGIAIPGKDISYNPLDLAKTDGVATVNPDGTLTYTISYKNTNPTLSVDGVTIKDTLPAGVTYVSSLAGGIQTASDVVEWDIGILTGGQSGSVTVTVTVDSNTPIGTVLDNAATIDSDNTPPTTQHDFTTVVAPNGGEIPEFPTIVLPMAAILGLAFMFQRRKD